MGASGDTAFDAASGPNHKFYQRKDIYICVRACVLCVCVFVRLPGYCGASRTRPPPGLLLSLRSPPTIKSRKTKGIDRECDGSKSSVTFIAFHFLHYAVNAEQRVHEREGEREKEERGRQRKGEEEKWACPGTLLLAGQFGRAEGRYRYR